MSQSYFKMNKDRMEEEIANLRAENERLLEIINTIKGEYICSHCGTGFKPFYPIKKSEVEG